MADITMCKDEDCPRRANCYRFMAHFGEYQSVWVGSPREGEECKEYMQLWETLTRWQKEAIAEEIENGR